MSPRAVALLGIAMFVVGVALPAALIAKRGPPWGFRGHRAVWLEGAGDVQLADAEGNRKETKAGRWIEVGDEVRAGRFSTARAKLPEGVFALMDSAVARVTARGLQLQSGAVDVTVPPGTSTFVVELEGFEHALTVRPAGNIAQARVLADGKGAAYAHMRAGSLEVGGVSVETGQVVALRRGQAPKVTPAPSAVQLTASCDGARVTVTATAGTQVFVPGFARISDGGALVLDAPAGASRVVVSARDVAGNVAQPHEVPCAAAAAPAPAPERKPASTPPRPQPKDGAPGKPSAPAKP